MCGTEFAYQPPLRPTCLCCNAPLDVAVRLVVVAEVVLGIAFLAFIFFYVRHICIKDLEDDQQPNCYKIDWLHDTPIKENEKRGLPSWFSTVYLVFAGIQLALTAMLYHGVKQGNTTLCMWWALLTMFSLGFTGIFLHLYQVFIVREFCKEIHRIEREGLGVNFQVHPEHLQVQLASVNTANIPKY